MGTRALIIFTDETETEIAVLYRHCDGYPTVTGQELKDTFGVMGFYDSEDLAVRVVAGLKTDWEARGNYYLYAAGTRDIGEEWTYTLSLGGHGGPAAPGRVLEEGAVWVRVAAGERVVFDGPLSKLDPGAAEEAGYREED